MKKKTKDYSPLPSMPSGHLVVKRAGLVRKSRGVWEKGSRKGNS